MDIKEDTKERTKIDEEVLKSVILVYQNDKFEIYVICWSNNCLSLIHNHPQRGCLMKILDGILEEELYSHPTLGKELLEQVRRVSAWGQSSNY